LREDANAGNPILGKQRADAAAPSRPGVGASVAYTAPLMLQSFEQESEPLRAVLVAVQAQGVADGAFSTSLAELHRLARTLGLVVAATLTQRRTSFHPGTVIGSGKLKELQVLTGAAAGDEATAETSAADAPDSPQEARPIKVVLVDHDISPSQARNLEKATGAEVMDRTAVILEIFRRHARSRVAKAQVEIVRLQYMAPRMRETGAGKDRQRGGIGGKGAGESGLELDRRKIRDRIAELTDELSSMAAEQATQRARRGDMNRVALVGYTNAGKSTLMRALTGSEVYVADKLFATLDTTVRTLAPESHPRILVSDTVGFIDKLPHGLVASFKSTLDETLEAGLLAHVVDASDPGFERQLEVTREVLADIGAGAIPRLIVFNKMDRLGDGASESAATEDLLARWPDSFAMSARRPADVARLREHLIAFFTRDLVAGEIRVPYDRQHLRGEIFASCEVLGERYQPDAVIFEVRAHPAVLERLRAA
jgi:GTPase